MVQTERLRISNSSVNEHGADTIASPPGGYPEAVTILLISLSALVAGPRNHLDLLLTG